MKFNGQRKAPEKQVCYYCKVIPAIDIFLQITLYEDSKCLPKWVMILPQLCHCILHEKHTLIIFTCNILPDNARWHEVSQFLNTGYMLSWEKFSCWSPEAVWTEEPNEQQKAWLSPHY